MNETECAELLASVKWTDPGNLISLAVLAFINVLVIVGNCLVIAAVFCSHKLRSVTNFFIVSLAVADLLVGIAVLPFSATWEVFKVWIFGDLWCRIWLAVDVWMCTASILNLCAISLDRYVAVTRPVTYPSIMSTKRAKSLIAGIWILSFVICFPPLVGWKDGHKDQSHLTHQRGNQTTVITVIPTEPIPPPPPCPWTCELTNDAGYVVYSALGSFYIPMFVMLFFYWRIYRAAVRTTRAINQGFKTTKGSKTKNGLGERFDESRMTLRMHRGRGGKTTIDCCTDNNHSALASTNDTPLPERNAKSNKARHNRLKISYSYPSSEHLVCDGGNNSTKYSNRDGQKQHHGDAAAGASCSYHLDDTLRQYHDCESVRVGSGGSGHGCHDSGNSGSGSANATPQRIKKQMGKRNIKVQVKRFRMETKAAKTLAIIVGGFIFCWLPFFTMYLVRAFCQECIKPLLFSILFWLGYCNSAINPVIYALFSKEFRFAFKRIICKCFCRDISSYNQRGAAELMKRLTPTLTPVITRNIHMDQHNEQHPHHEHQLRAVKSMPSHSEYRR